MNYRQRIVLFVLTDSIIVLTAIYLGSYILSPSFISFDYERLIFIGLMLLIFHHIFAVFYKLYRKAWEYASMGEVIAALNAVTLAILFTGGFQLIWFGWDLYIGLLFVTWTMHILLIAGSRLAWYFVFTSSGKRSGNRKRVLIIGAGSAGRLVARHLKNNSEKLKPIAFIDDDQNKQGLQYYGVKVIGSSSDISKIVTKLNIDHIIIALPSVNKKRLKYIFHECIKTNAKTQTIPKMEDLLAGELSVSQFRDVDVNDLLGRQPVELDTEKISIQVKGKTILVTGAGGSIGSEICRQVATFQPQKLLLVGHGEFSIYKIHMELTKTSKNKEIEIVPIIGDIQDRELMFNLVYDYRPDIIYHAAAHKHVPLMEQNPKEAIKNNIVGTRNVAEAAHTFGVDTFVLISTDKAVKPVSVMGASKRIAELIITEINENSETKFASVRFGNVLGSRGSVVPLFKEQIKAGGPITVTHPEMTRYFMTIKEASQLVIQASALSQGGEIFVLDMGEPIKIVELAQSVIQMSGYEVEEIGIEFSGIRPGERLHEKTLHDNEIKQKQIFPKIALGKSEITNHITYRELNMDELEDQIFSTIAANKEKSI